MIHGGRGRVEGLPATRQVGLCGPGGDGGTPTCSPGACLPGYYDIDPAKPGCEYKCTPSSPPTEVCDGRDNDCNGTADDGSIGSAASHGCIRMHVSDVVQLYPRVPLNTPLYIS